MRAAIAVLLAALAFVAVVRAQDEQGIVRDEVVYMTHGDKYAAFWRGLVSGKDGMLAEAEITRHFGGSTPTANNREHPPLMKTLMGLSHALLHERLGWASEITSYRLPSAAMNALLVALVFLIAQAAWGMAAGIIAGLLTLCLPRAFFHAGLGCFDAAIVTMWVATLGAYYRALAARRWVWVLGVCFGLALATKHNALMLPAVMGCHYAWIAARRYATSGRFGARLRGFARGLMAVRPSILVALVAVGPLVLIAVWPWLWFDTLAHLRDWIAFHLRHVHYNFEYLGENWNASPYPWHVPIVTTVLTVPVVTLAAALIGGVAVYQHARGRAPSGFVSSGERAPAVLWLLSLAVAMGPFLLGTAPIFGAEKHWAPAIPTLCMLAGVGAVYAAQLMAARLAEAQVLRVERAPWLARTIAAVLGALMVAAAVVETAAAHPYALSHYNALAGGAPGGADLGMNRQFWGYAARGVLDELNRLAPGRGGPEKPVYTHDASPAWPLYRKSGLLAPGLPDAGHEHAGIRRSKIAIVIHERHFNRHIYMIWDAYGTVKPVYVLTFQGVPLVSVYAR